MASENANHYTDRATCISCSGKYFNNQALQGNVSTMSTYFIGALYNVNKLPNKAQADSFGAKEVGCLKSKVLLAGAKAIRCCNITAVFL